MRQKIDWLGFWVLVLWGFPVSGGAFESLKDEAHGKLTCQTACHLPQNKARARAARTLQPECRACHEGGLPLSSLNPFRTPTASIQREDQHPNRRMLSPRPPTLAAKPAASAPLTRKVPKVDGMAHIPAGEFIMGSNERWDDESPEHISRTGTFYIDLYEVTNADYKKFVDATKRQPPHHWARGEIPKDKNNHPVIYVSWFDAHDYCEWTGKRLPDEKEWEKAARGEDGLIYPWGNVWTLDKSNNPYKHSTGTEPVGSYPGGRSIYGLYDMSGNVWEWVDAYYLPHPGNTIPKAEYGKDKRVLKGGSWFDCLSYGCGLSAPTFNRSFFNPEVKNNSFGFRCAKSAK